MSKDKMSLGVDVDGVFVDFDRDWRMIYIREFGIIPKPTTMWDFPTHTTHFETDAQFWKWLSTTDIWEKPHTLTQEVETLRQYQDKYDLHMITTKPDWAVQRTLAWIPTLRINWKGIHIGTFQKSSVKLDCYVDDAPHNLIDYMLNTDEEVFRYDQPYNRLDELADTIPVKNLQEVFNHMDMWSTR